LQDTNRLPLALKMARGRRTALIAASALAVAYNLRKPAFVPAPDRRALAALPAAAVAAAAAPAYADAIGDAAKKLSAASYPFLKEVDWNSYLYLTKPGSSGTPEQWAKAVGKMIAMGAKMDPALLKAGVQAHHKPIAALTDANPVVSQADFEAINAAIGRMIASVPEDTTMDVYNTISGLVGSDVPAYLMSRVKEADAKKAYEALMEFKDVVKANPIAAKAAETPSALAGKLGAVDAAAAKLSEASYPFMKEVAWGSPLFQTQLPGVTPVQVMKAIDKMLVMGANIDSKTLQDAANAHASALQSMDSNLVTDLSSYTAVNAGIGKMIASVPTSQVMDVYNAMAKIVNPVVPNFAFNTVNPNDAQAAYNALLTFKDVVKSAQR